MKYKHSLLGEAIAEKLYEMQMSQRELAREIGMSEKYLSDVMRGRRSGSKYKKILIERLEIPKDIFE